MVWTLSVSYIFSAIQNKIKYIFFCYFTIEVKTLVEDLSCDYING